MSLRWLILVVSLYSVSVHGYEPPVDIFEYVDNERVVAFVNESDINASANWKPESSAPALSLSKAIAIVHDYADSNEEMKGASLEEIDLRRIPHYKDKWHYMVKMKSEADNHASYHYVGVLMNGKVIPALREPESIK